MLGGGGSVVGVRVLLSAATNTVTQKALIGSAKTQAEREHVTIKGAKNILLVGLDTRPGKEISGTRSDSVIILHVDAPHTQAYVISLPRDSLVAIPQYDNGKVPYAGGHNKLNSAFAFGSRGLAGDAALSHGFELLAQTVKNLTGITPDAGAIIDFEGFTKVVEVLGKVCMYVDEDTTSIHIGHDDKTGKRAAPYIIHPTGVVGHRIPGVTPNLYRKGQHCFTPTEALDFVRQRDVMANNDFDYGRQRHQQQFLKALLKQIVDGGLSSPTKLPGLMSAVGKAMTVDDGGIPLEDWVFAMRGIKPEAMVTVKVNNGKFNSRTVPGVGSAEILDDTSLELLRAVKNDAVAEFVLAHPGWVSAT
jgi:LCP family protein required for cell wall assembly